MESPTDKVDSKLAATLQYTFKEYQEGEKWYNHLSANLSLTGSADYKKDIKSKEHPYNYDNGWHIDYMKPPQSISDYFALYSWRKSLFDSTLYKLFNPKDHKK